MFGPFKASNTLLGGLLWKIPWKMSRPQKQRQRHRLQDVDSVLKNLNLGLHTTRKMAQGVSYENAVNSPKLLKPGVKQLRLLNKNSLFPSEKQMSYRDKYTYFNKQASGYRKGTHKLPKWTKISQRRNPHFF
ncbi:LANO_0D07536g1_1 [Lachancea nothofagi CBS 11611]|uniref:LANO_0D07536g1_1 n=1 Tax=Lachancea nothofagi CBS 11611 TaxID=1266666 RepID=A0A1G4JIA3_9SACH|nr:LANO_0D07536g1_1 [Lachancea nothofagi CBS 11611]